MAVVLATWPIVYLADRLRGVDPPASLRVGLDWARRELRYGRSTTSEGEQR